MHKEITIYKIYKELEEKRGRLRTQLDSLDMEKIKLREQCPHSLVIKLTDSDKYDFEVGYTMCPICHKMERVGSVKKNSDSDSSINNFSNSKLINLSELKPSLYEEYYDIMVTVGEIIMRDPEYYFSDLSSNLFEETILDEIKNNNLEIKQRKREI